MTVLLLVTAFLLMIAVRSSAQNGDRLPERPRVRFEVPKLTAVGHVIHVGQTDSLQKALEAARPGDTVSVAAGASLEGPFRLPRKRDGDDWIVIQSSAINDLPAPGSRVDPSHAARMATLVARTGPVISADPGAHHYRFVGISIQPASGVFLYNLVDLGSGERSLDTLPHHIIFDRCYMRGDPTQGTRRAIAFNVSYGAVIDSYLSDFKEVGADSQAIVMWNGPGPYKIVNNYLEGAGENIMLGGEDPGILQLIPSDIEIRRNHFSKPLLWNPNGPSYRGARWTVKNLFELKSARRVLIEDNLFEHSWVHGQIGFAIVLTPRNSGHAPWTTVEDVVFKNNIVRHAAGGVNMLGQSDVTSYPTQGMTRVLIQNNLFDDIGTPLWGRNGRLYQILNGVTNMTIDHNTAFQSGPIILADGAPTSRLTFTNNLGPHNAGILGSGTGVGLSTLATYFPGAVVTANVMIGGPTSAYPPGNFFPAVPAAVGFADFLGGDYRLSGASAYRNRATDHTDIGADFAALSSVIGATSGGVTKSSTLPAE